MKKLLRILLVSCVCIFTTLSFVSCADATNASDQTPVDETDNGTQAPSEPIVPIAPEDPNTPTEPTAHEHTYGEWVIVTEATCTQTGLQQRYCTGENCESCETEIIATKAHTYDEVIKEATCTQDGSKSYTCVCGYISKSEIIPASGHDHKFIETIAPTCTEKGYDLYRCHCGDEKRTNEKEASGHIFDPDTYQCKCGLFQSPMENLIHSHWTIQGLTKNIWVIYFADETHYTSYLVTNPDNEYNYKGTYIIDKATNTIYFDDVYLEGNDYEYPEEFHATFSGDQATGVFELNSKDFKSQDTTFIFAGYKVL